MSKLVRAENPDTGGRFTTSEAYAKRKGLNYSEKGATDRHGRIRRPVARKDLRTAASINASMHREELEAAALAAGMSAEDIAAAPNKGRLVAAVRNAHAQRDDIEPADLDRGGDLTTTDSEPADGSDTTTEA